MTRTPTVHVTKLKHKFLFASLPPHVIPVSLSLSLSQTVFGELISVSPNETLSKALGTFLLERLLSNQQITEAYARPNTTGGFQEGRRDGRIGGGRGEKAVEGVLTHV